MLSHSFVTDITAVPGQPQQYSKGMK